MFVNMKKNTIIGLLTILFLLSMAYGIYQKIRADRIEENLSKEFSMKEEIQKRTQEVLERAKGIEEMSALEIMKQKEFAEEQKKIAEQQKQIAEKQKRIAEVNSSEAMKQKRIAEEQKRMMEKNVVEAKKALEAATKLYNEQQKK